MTGLRPADAQTFFLRPDQTQMMLIRNQNNKMVNSPDSGKRVPEEEAQAMIVKNHQAAIKSVDYVEKINAKAEELRNMNERLAQYTRQDTRSRVGNNINTQA